MALTHGSLFSGIDGFGLGFADAGIVTLWQAEKDKQARTVLEHHNPDILRFKDVRNVSKHTAESVDIISGGFPCQDISVAGRREGLAGERSGLWFEFLRILEDMRPRWCVIENVRNLLSVNGGRDFATILRGLVGCGYGVAWRILDARYWGVAQRRRRVFIVGHLGADRGRVAKVLFESSGVQGSIETLNGERAKVANALTPGAHPGGLNGQDAGRLIIAKTLTAKAGYRLNGSDDNLIVFDAIAFDWQSGGGVWLNVSDKTSALHAGQVPAVFSDRFGIRRLTPKEEERLQGFPDGYTAVNGQSDSARYRQLGNAVCVPVVAWLGARIVAADSMPRTIVAAEAGGE